MNLELQARRRIETANATLNRLTTLLGGIDRLLNISRILTFLMLLGFALALYVGDIWYIENYIKNLDGGYVGLIFFTAIAFMLAYVLSGSKHAIYIHSSLFRVSKWILIAVVMMGLFAEVFNSSGVQDMKARSVSENSTEHKALISAGSVSNVTLNTELTDKIAKASTALARCRERIRTGRETHCRITSAKLVELRQAESRLMEAQVGVSNKQQTERFERLDDIKDSSYNPIIRSISSTFNVSMPQAISILMFAFAMLFEILHLYQPKIRRELLQLIEAAEQELHSAESAYASITGAEYSNNGEHIRKLDMAKKEDNLFNYQKQSESPATAENVPTTPAIVEPLKPAKQPFGFAPTRPAKPAESIRTNEPTARAARLPTAQEHGKTGRSNPVLGRSEHHYELPLTSDDKDVVSNPSDNVVQSKPYNVEHVARNVSTRCLDADKTTSTTIENNVPSKAMNNVPAIDSPKENSGIEPVSNPYTLEKAPKKKSKPATKKAKKTSSSDVYAQWKSAILNGDIKPTIKDSRPFIQKLVAGDQTQRKTPTLKDIGVIAKSFFLRACLDKNCPIQERPDYKFGQRDKYVITK